MVYSNFFLDYMENNTGGNIIIYHAMKFNFEHEIKNIYNTELFTLIIYRFKFFYIYFFSIELM